MFTKAIVRKPGKNFAQGLTTAAGLKPPDYHLILRQHEAYVETLKSIGLGVIALEPLPDYPDAYFVEDTAVVTEHIAIITNPGADTRKGEETSIAAVLAEYRNIEHINPPGTVDGGDVLQIANHFFIGLSERTNQEGAAQLGRILQGFGYTYTTISVGAGLHFKSSVNYIGKNTLLVADDFAEHRSLKDYQNITAEDPESYAANTLLVNDHLLTPVGFPQTRKKLDALGMKIIELDMSEVQKMDGGLTCMSIRF